MVRLHGVGKVRLLVVVSLLVLGAGIFHILSDSPEGAVVLEQSSISDLRERPPVITEEEPEAAAEDLTQTLKREADRENIDVSDAEVDQFIKHSLDAYQMSEAQLHAYLDQAGMSYSEYKASVKEQMRLAELVQKNVDVSDITVSEDEVDRYIEDNRDLFEEFYDDEEAMQSLRKRVRAMLLQDKQTRAVMEYVNSIQ